MLNYRIERNISDNPISYFYYSRNSKFYPETSELNEKNMKSKEFSIYCSFPSIRFSSSDPDPNNDWSDWKENDSYLYYDDILFVALEEGYYDTMIKIVINSDILDMPDGNCLLINDDVLKSFTLIASKEINLNDDKILDFGDDFETNQLLSTKEIINLKIYQADNFEFIVLIS